MIRAAWRERIAQPPEAVFDLLANLDRESEWNPDASNAVRTSPGGVGLGAVWEQDFRRAGHVVSVVDGYERPRALSFHVTGQGTEARVRYTLLPVGSHETDVSCEIELVQHGWRRLLEPLRAPRYRRRLEHARGPQLKRALER